MYRRSEVFLFLATLFFYFASIFLIFCGVGEIVCNAIKVHLQKISHL